MIEHDIEEIGIGVKEELVVLKNILVENIGPNVLVDDETILTIYDKLIEASWTPPGSKRKRNESYSNYTLE